MEKKAIVKIDFTGRDLNSGKVFDTTVRGVAESEGIPHGSEGHERKYAPLTVILGKGEIHKALEEEIEKMKEGEQRKIVLEPEKAFGERKAQDIVVMPLKNFIDNKMQPFPGMVFDANGMQGKVQSVSGGRVRVDFNHPLAGKKLEYDIRLVKEITDKKEKISALYEKFLPVGEEKDRKFELKGEELTVLVPKQLDLKNAEPFKKIIEKIMMDNIDGVKKVSFAEATQEGQKAVEKAASEAPAEEKENAKNKEKPEKGEKKHAKKAGKQRK